MKKCLSKIQAYMCGRRHKVACQFCFSGRVIFVVVLQSGQTRWPLVMRVSVSARGGLFRRSQEPGFVASLLFALKAHAV